jgi:hypothetical protein
LAKLENFDTVIELMAAPAVAAYLGIARPSALQIIRTGLAGPIYSDGQREAVDARIIEKIKIRPVTELDRLPPAIVVRVGAPQIDLDDPPGHEWKVRTWFGWHKNAPKADQRAGTSRWWRVRDADRLAQPPGQLFVVTVSGLVVDVTRIKGASQDGSYWAFDLRDPTSDDSDAQVWRDVRLRPVGGGPVIRHGIQ